MLRVTRIALVAVTLLGQLACTNAAVEKAVGTANGASTVVVVRTERGITVENRAGRPLLNIRLEIESAGPSFVYVLPTLDTSATREIPFADFHTEDGTLFDAGSATAKQVKATARDTLGNSYQVATPWEP